MKDEVVIRPATTLDAGDLAAIYRPFVEFTAASFEEVSACLHPDFHRRGIGRVLCRRLFGDLAAKGYCQAFAGIALPG